MNCIGNIGFVIIAAFGGYFSINGLISVGVISAFIVYAKQFSKPINEIAQIYGQLQTAIAGAERVFTVLDEENEEKTGEALAEEAAATVTFRNVQFSYVPEHPVIHDFTLTVPSGKKVALVGATGSGKTTVVNLMMRFLRYRQRRDPYQPAKYSGYFTGQPAEECGHRFAGYGSVFGYDPG